MTRVRSRSVLAFGIALGLVPQASASPSLHVLLHSLYVDPMSAFRAPERDALDDADSEARDARRGRALFDPEAGAYEIVSRTPHLRSSPMSRPPKRLPAGVARPLPPRALAGNALVRGRVLGWDGAPLVGATVDVPGARASTVTDRDGRFSLRLPTGRHTARIARLDHAPLQTTLDVFSRDSGVEHRATRENTFALQAADLRVETIEVTAPRTERPRDTAGGHYVLQNKDVQSEIGSFEDIMRSVQSLPGVARASDYHGEYFVRGAGANANTVYLDGVPIFFPYHILGFNSIFNPGIVESAEFYAGGAPAAYGGATGGLMLVRSRGETPSAPGGSIGLSYLSGHLRAAGGDSERGWVLSVRRSYHDQIAKLVDGSSPNDIPSFHDGMLRVRWQPSDSHLLVAGALSAGDGMSIANPEGQALRSDFVQVESGDGNLDSGRDQLVTENRLRLGSLYWRALLGDDARLETRFGVAPQRLRFSLRGENNESLDIHTRLLSFRQDLSLRRGAHRFQLGVETYRTRTSGLVSSYAAFLNLRQTNSSLNLSDQPERYRINVASTRLFAAAYGQDDWRLQDGRVEFSPGLRYEYDGLTRELLVSPRAALTLRPLPNWELRGTWGIYSMPRNSPMEVQPTRSGEPLRAERAQETSFGVTHTWPRGWKAGASGFHKTFTNLVYESEPAYYENGAAAESHGVETWVELAPHDARFHARLRYAWSHTRQRDASAWRRQLSEDPAAGDATWGPVFEQPYWYSPMQDQRHRVGLEARLRAGAWEFGTHLQVASGLPFTPVASVAHDAAGDAYGIVGRKGSARLPRYTRLDFRVTRHFRGDRLHWRLYGEVLNATASDNVYMYRWNREYTSQYAVHMLPLLPTLGVEASF